MDYISGSSGFIGSHLLKRLPDAKVIPHEKLENVPHLEHLSRFFFLSTYGNIYGQTDVHEMLNANVLDMLGVFSGRSFKSFVFVSSSSVNLKVQTPYSRTKRAAEEILLSYDAPVCIIRPYSITGVGDNPKHLIPTLIRSCLTGELMDFVSWPSHDYLDVEDFVSAMLDLSSRKGVFEVGSGTRYANWQILEMVEKITGKKANIHRVNSMRPYDQTEWVGKKFNRPFKTLEQSIVEMVYAAS